MKKLINLVILASLATLIFISCGEKKPEIDKTAIITKAKAVFKQLPAIMPGSENDTAEIIALGKELYFDVRLSKEDNQSCNTCHAIDYNGAGVDNLPTSPGSIIKTIGTRNSPTVLNALNENNETYSDKIALEQIAKQLDLTIPKQIASLFDAKIIHNTIIDVENLESEIISFLKRS